MCVCESNDLQKEKTINKCHRTITIERTMTEHIVVGGEYNHQW